MSKKRTRIEIINDILNVIAEKQKIKPTHLMYKSNLSHTLMKSYLEELIVKEMVQKVNNKEYEYLVITEKGIEFIGKFKKMKEFEETFGL
ncbi:MAG: winged helix-turn-helix domain-containing protein [Candidatus Nanoarchaeia archaeon]|nr:winged helix-turn-helix domain-containing protein [Candidatus Nanoarchaeia archaeon]MDD5587521.1 winged helix-turn-helix domain-containing protein [Candidatus Nanoarchaeia archaeon]